AGVAPAEPEPAPGSRRRGPSPLHRSDCPRRRSRQRACTTPRGSARTVLARAPSLDDLHAVRCLYLDLVGCLELRLRVRALRFVPGDDVLLVADDEVPADETGCEEGVPLAHRLPRRVPFARHLLIA